MAEENGEPGSDDPARESPRGEAGPSDRPEGAPEAPVRHAPDLADEETRSARADQDLRLMLSSRRVANRATVRGATAAILLLVYFFLTDQTADDMGEVIGIAMIAVGALDGYVWFKGRGRGESTLIVIRAGVMVAAGVVLALWPNASLTVLDFLLGVYLLGWGAIEVARSARRRTEGRRWLFTKGLLILAVGALVVGHPATAAGLIALGTAIVWIGAGVIALLYALRADGGPDDRDLDPLETVRILAVWLRSHELEPDERAVLTANLFFDGTQFRARLFRFYILMTLSVAIATFGVIQDSTATVIGAMLIAPLMTPIMGVTAALTMGWPLRAARAGLTVAFGTAVAIGTSLILVQLLPNVAEPIATSQVTSRVSPTMIDMAIALAAGAAGAFAMSRPDVSDSLPGVAIAVALVPPLSVVGVTLEAGQYGDAAGALLLFLTNLVSILLAGSIVFVLTGYTPLYRLQEEREKIRLSMATIMLGAILVVVPLAATGQKIASDALAYDEANAAVDAWLGDDTKFHVDTITVDGSTITVQITGPGDSPATQDLADLLSDHIGGSISVELNVIPEETSTADSSSG
jgi:uncharacterized hydrophobic protein (TIGR00271 family)